MNAPVIRRFVEADWAAVWSILEPIMRAGETYAFPRDISETEMRRAWIEAARATFVAEDGQGQVLGTYFVKPNQAGPGDHICNCGYAVGTAARGRGIARAMCLHSQDAARDMGFLGMQFNLVVSTNTGAVALWQTLGFAIIGTLPGVFRHPSEGRVDAHVMFKELSPLRP